MNKKMFKNLKNLKNLFSVLFLVSVLFNFAYAMENHQTKNYEKILDNGLKIIVKENHRAPTAVQMLWYKVGSIDEIDGKSGLDHLLEHMMFKGTPDVPAGEFSKRVAAAGGRDNAFTSNDYTAYFQQIPSHKLEAMMALESDRMKHLSLDEHEFQPELKVVMEERRLRTDDNPQAKLFEQLRATMWQVHPYRRPVIGWQDDLENLTADDTKQWFKTWYSPNNATLVIVGDVQHQQVFEMAQKYYGDIPRREIPKRRDIKEPKQQGTRRINVKGFASQPLLVMSWKVPTLKNIHTDKEAYALEMLTAVLDGNESSRLNRNLVRKKNLATYIAMGYDGVSRGPGSMYVIASPAENVSVEDLEKAIQQELAAIYSEKTDFTKELQRAKIQYTASQIYKRDSLFGQAMEIGMDEAMGLPWQSFEQRLQYLQQVSQQEVKAVAKKYLVEDTLTVGVLIPEQE